MAAIELPSPAALSAAGHLLLFAVAIVAAVYVAAYQLVQLLMLGGAWLEARRQRAQRHLWQPRQVLESRELPGISVVIPAYNESISIVRTVRSILACGYPNVEVLVVNDGSTDDTLARLEEAFALHGVTNRGEAALPSQPIRQLLGSRTHPALLVVDKRNGGKADALNAGINYATRPLVCAIDADVVLDRWALYHLARPFLDDPATVASSGMIRLQNGCRVEDGRIVEIGLPRRWLERMQVVEYLRAFSVGRLFFNLLNAHLIISGAFGLFSRSMLLELGGYQPFAIGEDMELVVRLHRHLRARRQRYRISFVADAICYTEAPNLTGELGRQRTRWHQGLLTTLRLHRRMMLRPSYGTIGTLILPYFLFMELLAPVIELAGWALLPLGWLAGWISGPELVPFLLASMVLGSAVSCAAIAVDSLALGSVPRAGDRLRLVLYAFLEHLGYHQLTLWFRLRAFPRFYRSIHLRGGWRSPKRIERPPSDLAIPGGPA